MWQRSTNATSKQQSESPSPEQIMNQIRKLDSELNTIPTPPHMKQRSHTREAQLPTKMGNTLPLVRVWQGKPSNTIAKYYDCDCHKKWVIFVIGICSQIKFEISFLLFLWKYFEMSKQELVLSRQNIRTAIWFSRITDPSACWSQGCGRSVWLAEWLVHPTGTQGPRFESRAWSGIHLVAIRLFIAQSLSSSSFHHLSMIEIMLKGT